MPGDETPLFSRRQLIQCIGQFAMIFLSGLAAHATLGGTELTLNTVIVSALQAATGTLAVLGFSYVPPHS